MSDLRKILEEHNLSQKEQLNNFHRDIQSRLDRLDQTNGETRRELQEINRTQSERLDRLDRTNEETIHKLQQQSDRLDRFQHELYYLRVEFNNSQAKAWNKDIQELHMPIRPIIFISPSGKVLIIKNFPKTLPKLFGLRDEENWDEALDITTKCGIHPRRTSPPDSHDPPPLDDSASVSADGDDASTELSKRDRVNISLNILEQYSGFTKAQLGPLRESYYELKEDTIQSKKRKRDNDEGWGLIEFEFDMESLFDQRIATLPKKPRNTKDVKGQAIKSTLAYTGQGGRETTPVPTELEGFVETTPSSDTTRSGTKLLWADHNSNKQTSPLAIRPGSRGTQPAEVLHEVGDE